MREPAAGLSGSLASTSKRLLRHDRRTHQEEIVARTPHRYLTIAHAPVKAVLRRALLHDGESLIASARLFAAHTTTQAPRFSVLLDVRGKTRRTRLAVTAAAAPPADATRDSEYQVRDSRPAVRARDPAPHRTRFVLLDDLASTIPMHDDLTARLRQDDDGKRHPMLAGYVWLRRNSSRTVSHGTPSPRSAAAIAASSSAASSAVSSA